jgi:hypothetical protein
MHLQVRCNPKKSPPDVEKLLAAVAAAGVNLVAIGGSNVEFGGELALVAEDGQEQALLAAVAEYQPRLLDVDDPDSGLTLCEVDNRAGALHRCLRDTAADNLTRGRIIRDILVGIPDADQRDRGVIPVHIYSEEVRTLQSLGS